MRHATVTTRAALGRHGFSEKAGGGRRSFFRSLTAAEVLEPRHLLATFSVPDAITRIDSNVHIGGDALIKQGPGTLVLSAANLHTGGAGVQQASSGRRGTSRKLRLYA